MMLLLQTPHGFWHSGEARLARSEVNTEGKLIKLIQRVFKISISSLPVCVFVGIVVWVGSSSLAFSQAYQSSDEPVSTFESFDCGTGYVRIAAGSFVMGSPADEEGRSFDELEHEVTITRDFCMKTMEVTRNEYTDLTGIPPDSFSHCEGDCPIDFVSWEDAVRFANEASKAEGLEECYRGTRFMGLQCSGYRLPTEAEWEYAARAGGNGLGGFELDDVAWYDQTSAVGPLRIVGQKQPNDWGLYDMLGNASEWTNDRYGRYGRAAVRDPVGPARGKARVVRGGSRHYPANWVRVSSRHHKMQDYAPIFTGFRLARSVPVPEPAKPSKAARTPSGSRRAQGVSPSSHSCAGNFVRIEPGTFEMGSPEREASRARDEALHEVRITRAFCMQTAEVTQAEYEFTLGLNPSTSKECGSDCPVETVNWDDAVAFANARSQSEGLPVCYEGSRFVGLTCTGYRLPTEAEWEYAARAGTSTPTYGDAEAVAWTQENSSARPHAVARKQPNAWGLYDMLGNVWEWTGDWYGGYDGRQVDPTGAPEGERRVLRGGAWFFLGQFARAAFRYPYAPINRYGFIGFRLVRTLD
jgi:formylglycine-generating enzyme required for sulfatase activity